MLEADQFNYTPHAVEFEKASYAYLIGILALLAGLPIPIINFMACVFYYLSTRKETEFIRWHALQEAILQFTMLIINSVHIYWLLSIFIDNGSFTIGYFCMLGFVIAVNFLNIVESAIIFSNLQKYQHIRILFFSSLTDKLDKIIK